MAINVVWVRGILVVVFLFCCCCCLVVGGGNFPEEKKRGENKAKVGERSGRGLIIQKELEEEDKVRSRAMLVN